MKFFFCSVAREYRELLPKVTYFAFGSSVRIRTCDLSTRESRHKNIEYIKEQICVVSFVYDRGSFFCNSGRKARSHNISTSLYHMLDRSAEFTDHMTTADSLFWHSCLFKSPSPQEPRQRDLLSYYSTTLATMFNFAS